jgi:hypothetical protein
MIEEIITAKLEHGSKNEKSLLDTMQTGIDFEISHRILCRSSGRELFKVNDVVGHRVPS